MPRISCRAYDPAWISEVYPCTTHPLNPSEPRSLDRENVSGEAPMICMGKTARRGDVIDFDRSAHEVPNTRPRIPREKRVRDTWYSKDLFNFAQYRK